MILTVQNTGERIQLKPADSIGQGGEADVYKIPNGLAAKVFKPPDHPDYENNPSEKKGAWARITEHQQKLPSFPQKLPARVITPQELLESGGKIAGYTMRLVQGGEDLYSYTRRNYREAAGIDEATMVQIFLDMHSTVAGLHKRQIVVGDFNHHNIMVVGQEAYFIDADSYQFGPYLCRGFTTTFVDPLLCNDLLVMESPHNYNSDWYAFANLLMRALLYLGPFDGVYRPKNPSDQMNAQARTKSGITIFHPEVIYPKPARPYRILPDELLHYFGQVFEKRLRGDFPRSLLENMRWTKCSVCGMEHARKVCPECTHAVAQPRIERRGKVVCHEVFETKGLILHAAFQHGKLLWLYHEEGRYKRENAEAVVKGDLQQHMRYRIQGDNTLIGHREQLVRIASDHRQSLQHVESFQNLPVFDANSHHRYWIQGGEIWRNDTLASKSCGQVLLNQTRFWVGETFGFGFYRAGRISVGFVFDAQTGTMRNDLNMPSILGQLVDARCYLSDGYAWFFYQQLAGGHTTNHCVVIDRKGIVVATANTVSNDGSWLGNIGAKCAVGSLLFAATDEGIVQLKLDGSQIVEARSFPDTEPFVNQNCEIFVSQEGMYVVDPHRILRLEIT